MHVEQPDVWTRTDSRARAVGDTPRRWLRFHHAAHDGIVEAPVNPGCLRGPSSSYIAWT